MSIIFVYFVGLPVRIWLLLVLEHYMLASVLGIMARISSLLGLAPVPLLSLYSASLP